LWDITGVKKKEMANKIVTKVIVVLFPNTILSSDFIVFDFLIMMVFSIHQCFMADTLFVLGVCAI
jgi:hypothetical protein